MILFPVLFILPLTQLFASGERPNFQDDVAPVFEQSCNSCHNPDKAKGGLDLTGMNGILAGGSSGEVVLPGDAEGSLLYLLTARLEEPHMPPRGERIEQASLDLIKNWIDQGLLPTASGKPMEKKRASVHFSIDSTSLGKPEGPPPMPKYLPKEPVVVTQRSFAPASMANSPWSPIVAIAGQKQILLYHTDTLDILGILPFPEGFAESLNFSRNGRILLAGGGRGGKSGRVVGWDVETGRRVLSLGEERDSILTADISHDQSLVVIGGPSKIVKMFDLSSGEILYQIEKHSEWVTQVSISPDGILLATGDRNGGLHIWETRTGNPFYSFEGHKEAITSLAWRIDSNMLASASEDGTIRTWEMQNGKQVKSWNAHSGGVLSLDFDLDVNLVSAGRDERAILWDLDGKEKEVFSDFKDIVVEACFSHDGSRIIVADWTGEISVWDSKTGEKTGTLSGNPTTIEQNHQHTLELLKKAQSEALKAKSIHLSHTSESSSLKTKMNELQIKLELAKKAATEASQAVELSKTAYQEASSRRSEVHKSMHQNYTLLKTKNLELKNAKKKKNKLSEEQLNLEEQISSFALKSLNTSESSSSYAKAGLHKSDDSLLAERSSKLKKKTNSTPLDLSKTKKELSSLKTDLSKITKLCNSLEKAAKSTELSFKKAKADLVALDLNKDNRKKSWDDAIAVSKDKVNKLERISTLFENAEKAYTKNEEMLLAATSNLKSSQLKLKKARFTNSMWYAESINLERHRELAKLYELENDKGLVKDNEVATLQPIIDQLINHTEDLLKSYLAALPE